MINVTKTFLPPLEEYTAYLAGIWERAWVTNHGPLLTELEAKLKAYLGVKHLFLVNNGTIALQIAIKALDLKGEIITTPFSYVATSSSIVWEGCTPVYADIDARTLCLDPALIAQHITPTTRAILATHVYGHSCQVEAIAALAREYQIPVIYDAAHAFGVQYKEQSILNFGDISTLSFHATKLFHTGEGGALITNNDELAHKIAYMMNFGHDGPENFWGLGINGKNSELHAALGLCVLPKIPDLIRRRREISQLYDVLLAGSGLVMPPTSPNEVYNYAYYPVIFPTLPLLEQVRDALQAQEIFPRRYFYPSLTTLPYAGKQVAQVTESVAPRILCLPLYHDLPNATVEQIARIIKSNL